MEIQTAIAKLEEALGEEKTKHPAIFEELLLMTERAGIKELIAKIRKTDFYTAPASTRHHSCFDGGLLFHSLNVSLCLLRKAAHNPVWKNALEKTPAETLVITSLLHDFCKTFYYKQTARNRKLYSATGTKQDPVGRFDWETYLTYEIDNKYPLGHGSKSVILLQQSIKLTMEEITAINYHMGFTIPQQEWNDLGLAMKKYPLSMALFEADLEATYLLEDDNAETA